MAAAAEAEVEISNKTILASQITYVNYKSEAQMPQIMELFQKDLSEPYTVYTYRYFINNWGNLCFLAHHETDCVGAIVCKLDARESRDSRLQNTSDPTSGGGTNIADNNNPILTYKGYIAMLAVKKEYRKLKIGSKLVKLAVNAMRQAGADEVVLETEVINKPALKLYENLGFLRDKRFYRYYLNGLDAFRLKLWIDITRKVEQESIVEAMASVKVGNTQATNQENNNSTVKANHDNNNKMAAEVEASCS